jgi:hypothetical protein
MTATPTPAQTNATALALVSVAHAVRQVVKSAAMTPPAAKDSFAARTIPVSPLLAQPLLDVGHAMVMPQSSA